MLKPALPVQRYLPSVPEEPLTSEISNGNDQYRRPSVARIQDRARHLGNRRVDVGRQ
jgi:hypothetical protein